MNQSNPARVGDNANTGLSPNDRSESCHGVIASKKTTDQLMKERGLLPLPLNAKHPYNKKLA